jgi:hypothetical protein
MAMVLNGLKCVYKKHGRLWFSGTNFISCMYFIQFLCESSCQVQAVFLQMLENYICFTFVYIASQACCSLNEDILTFFIGEVSLSASQTSC